MSAGQVSAAANLPWEQPGLAADARLVLEAAKSLPISKDAQADVFLEEEHYAIDSQGRVTTTVRLVYRVNTDAGIKNWADVGASWEQWRQSRPDIKARVISPDGTEHVLDTKTLVDAPIGSGADSMFDDTRVIHGPLPAIAIGSVVEAEIVLQDSAPLFDGGVAQRVRFGRGVPVQRTRLIIEVPGTTPLQYRVHLLPNATVTKEQVNGVVRVLVEQGPMEPLKEIEPNLPADVPRTSHVDFSTSPSWSEVAQRYSAEVEQQVHLESVRPLLPDLSRMPRDKKITTLVALLHKEVRYTGLEFGRSKLVPQTPAEVLKRKYGDCKDKATLLVALLRASGIPAHLALLTAGDIQDAEDDMPGMGIFNHAMVFVPGRGTPDLWIDATAEMTPVGALPSVDQGRKALIIRDTTKNLVATPEAKSSDNVNSETREFFLSELGPARVVETSTFSGDLAAWMRFRYASLTDESRKQLSDYMKRTYASEEEAKVEFSALTKLDVPLKLRLEVQKAKRGLTDSQDASVAMWPQWLVNELPEALRQKPDNGSDGSNSSERRSDFVLPAAFVKEWKYRIVPPPGFQVHGLPEDRTIAVGPAKLTEEFKAGPDGVVTATFRFDSVKRRYTVAEIADIRSAAEKLQKSPVVLINFDSTGYVLLQAGRIRESLAAYRSLIAAHPKEGLHHAQLATALLEAGLGEMARAEARHATELDPTSAKAYRTLGWVLQHDLIGRRFERGFDMDGAVAAYRKAKELDPKDIYLRADLAILLEHDTNGERYTEDAKLNEAVQEWREIKTVEKDDTTYDDNLAYALLYARRFQDAREFVTDLQPTHQRNAIRVAALAATDGAQAAIANSSRASQNESERNAVLYDAGKLLVGMRMYSPAVELMSAGTASKSNSPQDVELLEALRGTKRLEEIPDSNDTPENTATAYIVRKFGARDFDTMLKMWSKSALDDGRTDKERRAIVERDRKEWIEVWKDKEWPVRVYQEKYISGLKTAIQGDDHTGFRLILQPRGPSPYRFYIVKESGTYKVVSVDRIGPLGREAMARLKAGDLVAARRWLDWALTDAKNGTAVDDPLSRSAFARLWSLEQDVDQEALEYTAAALMTFDDNMAGRVVPLLERGREAAKTEKDRLKFDLAIAYACSGVENLAKRLEVSERLLKAEPRSNIALSWYVETAARLGRDQVIQNAMENRRRITPDDPELQRIQAQAERWRSNFDGSRKAIRALMDAGNADYNDMNNYAWESLFLGKTEPEDIEIAQRALSQKNNRNFATMHTLACLYAEIGKTKEARDLLVNSMGVIYMDEPDTSIWYGMGRIAEQYGELEAARQAYRHAQADNSDDPKNGYPLTTSKLVQTRLKLLGTDDRPGSAGR